MNGIEEKSKVALVTGITGQDGSYLADFLLEKGYKVIGLKRRSSEIHTKRIDHIFKNPNFILEYYNLYDCSRSWQLLAKYQPDEIYNLAAQSHVRVSFDTTEENCTIHCYGDITSFKRYERINSKSQILSSVFI